MSSVFEEQVFSGVRIALESFALHTYWRQPFPQRRASGIYSFAVEVWEEPSAELAFNYCKK